MTPITGDTHHGQLAPRTATHRREQLIITELARTKTMTEHSTPARRIVGSAALLVAAGLALAACKGSASASGSGTAGGGGSSASSGGSGGSSGGSGGASQDSASGLTDFPVGVGNTWIYQTSLTGSKGTATNKMIKVVPVAGGQQVTMAVKIDVAGLPGTPSKVTYVFHSDGSVTVPLTQFANGAVKLKSGSIVWPSASVLASGQPHKSTLVFATTIAGKTSQYTAHVTVQGGGSQSVTVPAGTYQAQVINETISENVEGVSVSLRLRTWMAKGVGPVKSALLTKSGPTSVPGVVEELKSFTKG